MKRNDGGVNWRAVAVKLKENLGLLMVVMVVVPLIATNFDGGSWLMGWDNLMPELNVGMNMRRSLSAVWQEYQGLGLLGGMGHAADLVRQLVVALLLLVIPMRNVRFVLMLLMLVVGPLGVYGFLKEFLGTDDKRWRELAAGLGAVFYVLNLGTLQIFYVPFEPFYWAYGFLPWLVWSWWRVLEKGGKKNWIKFVVVNVLAAPMAYVQQVYLVWLMVSGGMFGARVLQSLVMREKGKVGLWVRGILAYGLMFVLNAYWLLPVGFFGLTSAEVTIEAKANRLATPEVYLSNSVYANWTDVLDLKGYWFGLSDAVEKENFGYLMGEWVDYVGRDLVQSATWLITGGVVLGLAVSALGSEKKWMLVGGFAVVVVLLFGEQGWVGGVVGWLLRAYPVLGQAFRSPFTKVVMFGAWVYAVLFGVGVLFVLERADGLLSGLRAKRMAPVVGLILGLVVMGLMVGKMRPMLAGQLVYKNVKVDLPDEYLALIDYFKTKDKNERVAYFPVYNLWGWNFYDWNYRGSGFLWYGIEQPILDRAFDVWSRYNEGFYQELNLALVEMSEKRVGNVLSKYKVSYVIMDENVVLPGKDEDDLKWGETEALIEKIGYKKDGVFGKIKVYKRSVGAGDEGVRVRAKLVGVGEANLARDVYYEKFGDYVVSGEGDQFPFAGVMQEQPELVSINRGFFVQRRMEVTGKITSSGRLVLPEFDQGLVFQFPVVIHLEGRNLSFDFLDPIEIYNNGERKLLYEFPRLSLELKTDRTSVIVFVGGVRVDISQGETVRAEGVTFGVGEELKVNVYDDEFERIDLSESLRSEKLTKCWERPDAEGSISRVVKDDGVEFTVKDASGCLSKKLGDLGDSLVTMKLEYLSGGDARPHFCVVAEGSGGECLNREVYYSEPPVQDWGRVERSFETGEGNVYWVDVVARPSLETGQTTSIEYRDFSLDLHRLLERHSFEPVVWFAFDDQREVEVESGELKAIFYSQQKSMDNVLDSAGLYRNCDVFERGRVERHHQYDGLKFTAFDSAALCGYVYLNDLSEFGEHLFVIANENVEGRSLKFFVHSLGLSRNIIESILSGSGEDYYYVPSFRGSQSSGYRITFENRAFGDLGSVNRVKYVDVYSAPFSWLSQASVKRGNLSTDSDLCWVDGKGKKAGTAIVEVTDDCLEKEDRVVVGYQQGFDEGWQLRKVGRYGFGGCVVLPWSCRRVGQHVRVDGWANGWLMEGSVPEVTEEGSLVLVYWPQYLEWVGLGVLGLVVLGAVGCGVWGRRM